MGSVTPLALRTVTSITRSYTAGPSASIDAMASRVTQGSSPNSSNRSWMMAAFSRTGSICL